MPAEKVRLRIGNLAKAVLVSRQAYQDPKDALNEFVSNAADEYTEADRRVSEVEQELRKLSQSFRARRSSTLKQPIARGGASVRS